PRTGRRTRPARGWRASRRGSRARSAAACGTASRARSRAAGSCRRSRPRRRAGWGGGRLPLGGDRRGLGERTPRRNPRGHAEPIGRSAAVIGKAFKEIDMLGKIIGGVVGAKAANHVRGVGGTGGALLGIGAASLARRLGPVGLVAAVAGGYAFKRYRDKQSRRARSGPEAR